MNPNELKTLKEPGGWSNPAIISAIIGGVFAVIAALIGAYAVLVASGKEPTLPAFGSQTYSVEGTWVGTITASDESYRTQATYFIKSNCALGQACGTYEMPVYGCKGDLVYNGVTQDVYEFTEKVSKDSPDFCKKNTIDRFTVAAGDELSFSSLYIGEQGAISASGTLRRK